MIVRVVGACGWPPADLYASAVLPRLDKTASPDSAVGLLCFALGVLIAWHRVPISDGEPRREVQTSYLSDHGPGLSLASKDKLVRYERNWISEQPFIQSHEGYRIAERGPDQSERGYAAIYVRAPLAHLI